jgi:hypothetical protein
MHQQQEHKHAIRVCGLGLSWTVRFALGQYSSHNHPGCNLSLVGLLQQLRKAAVR